MLVAGCAHLKPISSVPPAKAIVLDAPFTVKHGFQTLTMPAGLYLPQFEDAKSYFYSAPSKVLGNDVLGSYQLDGGIVVGKDNSGKFSVYHVSPGTGVTDKWSAPRDFRPRFEQ